MTNRYLRGGLVQEVVLAMLAKEPSHGYELRARLREALGPVGEAMNAGQIYVTLGRLEKAGLGPPPPSSTSSWSRRRPDGWPIRSRSSTPSGASCYGCCGTPSAPR
jgi:hypothetical protein